MTRINVYTATNRESSIVRVPGVLRATPSEILVDGARVTIPSRETFTLSPGDDLSNVVLDAPIGWFWELELEQAGSIVAHRYVKWEPTLEEIDWEDLVDVDPETYVPLPEIPPSVQDMLDEIVTIRDEIRWRTVTARFDPNDPRVLILTFPAYRLDPDNPNILPLPVSPTVPNV